MAQRARVGSRPAFVSKSEPVPRPTKRAEYVIELATSNARKGWTDIKATARNATVDAWDQLTTDPLETSNRMYDLKGEYATVETAAHGVRTQRQYKVTDGGRIWYSVVPNDRGDKKPRTAGTVYLHRVEPGHPKETE